MSFKAQAAALGLTVAPTPADDTSGTRPVGNVEASPGDSTYGIGALRGLVGDIEEAGREGGRDNTFNRACLRAGELIRRGDLTRATAERALRSAGLAVSDDHDFTEYKVKEKIGRVIDQGIAAGYQTKRGPAPEPVPELPAFTPTPPAPELPADGFEAFWQARPALVHLRTFARARLTSPWAVLGVALARVIATAPVSLVLPPIVGSHASLNLFIALVGRSGGGKGAAENAAADALTLDTEVFTATVGSGEGIAHLYSHREKGEIVRDRDAVLFTIPEVDNLVALSNRQSSTLMPQLRSAWSGERLGFSYADKTKALPLDRHSYRMCLILGVQPGRAQPLIDDADGGTPQRFLWLPTVDAGVPEVTPDTPEPLPIRRPRRPMFAAADGLVSMTVCDTAKTTIIANRKAALRGDGAALDGHSLLARLKTAAAFGLLDGRHDITDEDWNLAGTVMTVSDHTRAGVVAHLAHVTAQQNQAKGFGEAQRAVTVAQHVEEAAVAKTAATLGRRLRNWSERDGWATPAELRRALTSPQRQYFEDALERLVAAGQVDVKDDRVHLYRWKENASR